MSDGTQEIAVMDTDLRSRVVQLEQRSSDNNQRLNTIETWQRQKDIDSARHDERWKHMDDRFNRLENKLLDVNGTLSWIARLIIGGIIMAVMAFTIGGGFSIK